jgi:FkbM family methyltransferase
MDKQIIQFLESLPSGNFAASYPLLFRSFESDPDQLIADALKTAFSSKVIVDRGRKLGALLRLRESGFYPQLVIDIGAQVGTPELFTAFPDAHHVFVEPVLECIGQLKHIASKLLSAEVINCAVSNVEGQVELKLSPSKQYSSIEVDLGGDVRIVDAITVDSILKRLRGRRPTLIKVDVDGVELAVLQGASAAFLEESIFVVEASIADDIPRFGPIVEFMSSRGFFVYDIVDFLYRPSDWHLWQVDLVFAGRPSPVWGTRRFS